VAVTEISTREAARRLHVNERRVTRYIERGELQGRKEHERRWLIEETSVERLARKLRVA
jgi:hypothetical protein